MDDTANWEFAAVVAAVCIGLGGLLLFTALGALGAWRVHEAAESAATQTARAAAAIEELAKAMAHPQLPLEPAAVRSPSPLTGALAEATGEIERLREQAAELLREQERVADAVRNMVQVGVLQGDQSNEQLRQLEQTLRRVEEHLVRITTPRTR